MTSQYSDYSVRNESIRLYDLKAWRHYFLGTHGKSSLVSGNYRPQRKKFQGGWRSQVQVHTTFGPKMIQCPAWKSVQGQGKRPGEFDFGHECCSWSEHRNWWCDAMDLHRWYPLRKWRSAQWLTRGCSVQSLPPFKTTGDASGSGSDALVLVGHHDCSAFRDCKSLP